MRTLNVVLVVAIASYTSAQTFGQLKACNNAVAPSCGDYCQKSTGADAAIVAAVKVCLQTDDVWGKVQNCLKTKSVVVTDSTLCWKDGLHGGPSGPSPSVASGNAVLAFRLCMRSCMKPKLDACLARCTANPSAGIDKMITACKAQVLSTAKEDALRCMKAQLAG